MNTGHATLGSDPVELLKWAAERFVSRIALSCSFGGAGGLVLAHMIHEHRLKIPVLFIDTGFLFPETYELKETFAIRYDLTIRIVGPDEQDEPMVPGLWERDPDACCRLRKVEPMQRALAQLDAWVCALRRDQAPTRRDVEAVEDHLLPDGRRICKINPLAYWTHAQVWGYIMRHNVPYNPLCDRGYQSIGCIQCTQPTVTGMATRSGRWSGSNKVECGLHTFTDRLEVPPQEARDSRLR